MNKRLMHIVIAIAVVVIGVMLYTNGYILLGNDKIAYDLISSGIYNFNDPGSLKVVSGTLGVDKDCIWFTAYASNYYGTRVRGQYWIDASGYFLNDSSYLCDGDDFNAELVTRALNRKFR